MNKISRRIYLKYSIVVIILLYCECFFFRNILGSENGMLISDRADGRLTTLLTEHWWNFFNGKENFSEIAMFYPAAEAFGYTDLFLGYGLIHSIFRLFGINMFLSYKYTLIAVHAMGTCSMYYLMNKKLKCNIYWSLFGTLAFCFSDTFARHLGHTQLNAISALPVLLILFLGFLNNYENHRKRNIYAYLLIMWFVLLTYTAWYIACFTGIFCMVFLIVYFIKLKICDVRVFSVLKEKLRFIWKDIIGYVFFMVILYIPFIKIYLPVLKSSGGYSYWESCAICLPEFADIINVTGSNLMLGKFIEKMNLQSRGYSAEVEMGFSIILLGLFLGLFIYDWKKNRITARNNTEGNIFTKAISKVAFISILVCIVLIIRLSSNGISLWIAVYHLLPVAKSVRAVSRFLLWLSFPMAVVTAYAANRYIKIANPLKSVIVSCIAVIMIFVSNINTIGVYSLWNCQEEYSFISKVTEPPTDAKVFYIIDTADTKDRGDMYQLDAFEIANWYSVKTINGYSGGIPLGWDMWDVCSEKYEDHVFEWIEKYNLTNVYAYDRATNEWIPLEERRNLLMDDVFCPAENTFSLNSGLQEQTQGEYVWTSQNFATTIQNTRIMDSGLVIKMETYLSRYVEQNADIVPYLQIYVDKELVQEVAMMDAYMEINIPMSNHDGDVYDIEIKTNGYFIPKDIGLNEDIRELSIALYYIGD